VCALIPGSIDVSALYPSSVVLSAGVSRLPHLLAQDAVLHHLLKLLEVVATGKLPSEIRQDQRSQGGGLCGQAHSACVMGCNVIQERLCVSGQLVQDAVSHALTCPHTHVVHKRLWRNWAEVVGWQVGRDITCSSVVVVCVCASEEAEEDEDEDVVETTRR